MDLTQIGRYEIQSELGRGGMAVVYLAFDPRFRRQVAVKVLPDRFLDHLVLRKRFEREAQTIAAIEHPAIVPVYDFGEQESQLYLVMRYMPGGSLETRLRQGGALALPMVASVVARLAHALDAVHPRGIIHRDLKPANILFDAYDNAYLSDFGIVHLAEATTALTGEGMFGTPAYMSPEQVQGLGKVDPRSDLYSLGIIVFEMLTGRQPFHASTPMATAMQHLTQPVPALKLFRAGLPPTAETLLQKAMAKDPAARFQTAESLAAELNGIVPAGLPEKAVQVDQAKKQPDQKPPPVAGSTIKNNAGVPAPAIAQTQPEAAPATLVTRAHPADFRKVESAQDVLSTAPPKTSQRALQYKPWIIAGMLGFLAVCGAIILVSLGILLPALRNGNPGVIFADSFSNPNSGWPSASFPNGAYGYDQDAYHISIHQPGDLYWVTPDRQAADVRVDVSATFATGSSEDYFGIVCRLQDADNFYYFVITSGGDYTVGKYERANFTSLLASGWVHTDAIHSGQGANKLRADCAGDRLAFTINDQRLQEIHDGTFKTGQYGLIASELGETGVEIIFDDFKVYKP